MAACNGNKFWMARKHHGPKLKFATPDDLWNASEAYLCWVVDNPLMIEEVISYQGKAVYYEISKMRAMTIGGLVCFLSMSLKTWHNYKKRQAFTSVVGRVERIIYVQKFEGVAAGLLNPNIIARVLG